MCPRCRRVVILCSWPHERVNLVTTASHQSTLILWDIDHTLVTIGEVSREIYEIAFSEVLGGPLRELAEMAGRTEQAILTETLVRHGVSDPESKLHDSFAALAKAADQLHGRMRAIVPVAVPYLDPAC